jgi:hypothetical protein
VDGKRGALRPLSGAELWEVAVRKIRELGLERSTIGVELGHSPV